MNTNEDGFLMVAEAASLPPGKGRTVEVRGVRFALWNLDGEFHALDDACPHRGASLGSGILDQGQVYCPLHGWAFDPRTGACSSNPARPVRRHRTKVADGKVYVELPGGK